MAAHGPIGEWGPGHRKGRSKAWMAMADGEGFEPSVPLWGTHAFQASPFDHSGTHPSAKADNKEEESPRGKLEASSKATGGRKPGPLTTQPLLPQPIYMKAETSIASERAA
jgi:hypothetical protein